MSSLVRRAAYRVGRAIYQWARGDVSHDMSSNGEMLVQRCVVSGWKGSSPAERLVVFDVGANVGDWSLAFARQLEGSVSKGALEMYLFEPVPSTFETLRKRLEKDNPTFHYEQVALSSGSGAGLIYVGGPNLGTNSLHADLTSNNRDCVAIVRSTVTEYCHAKQIANIHLLKCDTEGHDMEVIRGALELLALSRISVLQFEYNHRWIASRNFLHDVFATVEGLPYKLVKLQPRELLVFNEWHVEMEKFFHGNYALVHIDALKWFPRKLVSWDRYNTMQF